MLMDGSPLTKKVMSNTKYFREKMIKAGFNVIVCYLISIFENPPPHFYLNHV